MLDFEDITHRVIFVPVKDAHYFLLVSDFIHLLLKIMLGGS